MRINKTLILVILSVLGLSFQWLQSQGVGRNSKIENAEPLLVFEDVEPFARKAGEESSLNQKTRAAYQNARGRLVGQLPTPSAPAEELEFSHPETEEDGKALSATEKEEGEEGQEDGEEDEEREIVGYDEDGNPIYKEEDEEADDIVENEAPESSLDEEDKKEEEKAEAGNPTTEEYVTGGPAAQPEEEEDPEFLTYEEWANEILGQPNFEAVSRLVEHYGTGRVPKEIFYRLIREMLADSRAPMRKLGAMAAGLTPSLDSFLILAELNTSEPFGSELRADIESYLGQYATLTYLPVLEAVLLSNSEAVSPYATILAAQKLDQAARSYVTTETDNSSQGQGDSSEPQLLSSAQPQFQRFITILEDFIAVSPDLEAVNVAQTTLENLRSLLPAAS